jgi:hypothetical protein
MAAAVKIAGVDQVDPGVERGADGGNALTAVGGAVKVRHAHRAKTKGGNLRTRFAACAAFGNSLTAISRKRQGQRAALIHIETMNA